jgi:hypothetical protein
MKTTLVCLLAALAMRAAFQAGIAQTVSVSAEKPHAEATPRITFIQDGDRVLLVKGKVARELRTWLVIEAHNAHEWAENGFDPSYTRIVSDYKPMMRKLPSGAWELGFTSEIAEKIP